MNDALLPLIKNFISIPSDTNDREACLKILEAAQDELKGFTSIPFAKEGIPSLLYTNTQEPTKTCKIILNAHLDVVPGLHEQFEPYEKDGKLYGRGTFDMKAGAASMILAFKELAHQLPYTLGLQLTTDEELIGYNGVGYQLAQGVTADFAITGECTDFTIINKLKGRYVVKLDTVGTAAHSAYLWRGSNALLNLYESLQKIMEAFPMPKQASWSTTVNVNTVETTNIADNTVPHDASANLDIRYIPEDKDMVIQKLTSVLPEHTKLEVLKHMPCHNTEPTNTYLQTLTKAYEEVMHEQPTIKHNYGGSDIIFYSMYGINGIEFGPKGGGMHSDSEWVEIDNIAEYYNILKKFLLSVK